jgi:c-di-GMP-binding flagellar brake protein YcgR
MNRISVNNSAIEIGKPSLPLEPCRNSDDESAQGKLSDQTIANKDDLEDKTYTFEAMKMKVGDRLQIHLPVRFSANPIIVRLIGYISNLSLLVTPPREGNGLRMQVEENDQLKVRVFTSQNAFGFSSTVDKVIKIPFEYLHLSFPSEVKGMVIRKAPRVKTKIICSVCTEQSDEASATGVLVNLSANGALLTSRRALAAKSGMIKLAFRLPLHGTEAFLNLNAVVRAQFADETPSNPNPVHHGLEFIDLQANDRLVLQAMIYQQMIEQPHTVM